MVSQRKQEFSEVRKPDINRKILWIIIPGLIPVIVPANKNSCTSLLIKHFQNKKNMNAKNVDFIDAAKNISCDIKKY